MPRKRKLTRAQVLLHLQSSGNNRALAACRAGVSRATFFNAMRRYKISAPHPQEKITAHDANLIRQLTDAGITRAETAEKFEVSPSLVSRVANHGRK